MGVLNRFVEWCTQYSVIENNALVRRPIRVAVMLDYAHFIAPRGDTLQVSGQHGESVIRLLDWATDPSMVEAPAITDHAG